MRNRKHRGRRDRPIDRPMPIEKIENRFDKQLKEQRDLAAAYLLGKNKYGNTDMIPMRAAR